LHQRKQKTFFSAFPHVYPLNEAFHGTAFLSRRHNLSEAAKSKERQFWNDDFNLIPGSHAQRLGAPSTEADVRKGLEQMGQTLSFPRNDRDIVKL
jgi:hypothetical protein